MFAVVWWVWFALHLSPKGSDRLGVALAVAGAVAVAGGAPLAWWAGRESTSVETPTVPATPQSVEHLGLGPTSGADVGKESLHEKPRAASSSQAASSNASPAHGDDIRVSGPFYGPVVVKGHQVNRSEESGAR